MKKFVLLLFMLINSVYAQNALNEIIKDMRFSHEGYPHGVPTSMDWYWAPRLGTTLWSAKWTAMTGWGQVYEWAQRNPAANTRVHLKNMETWYLSGNDHQWHRLQNDNLVFGKAYVEDFAGNISKEADLRYEPDGGVSVIAGNGYNFHFWPSSSRVELPTDTFSGWFVTIQARLILDDPTGPDDRDQARYLLNMGADWWTSTTAEWADFTTNTDIGIGRFKFVRSNWQAFNMITIPYTQVPENPPPFQGDHSLDSTLIVHDNLLVNASFENGQERWIPEVHPGCEANILYDNNTLYVNITKLAPESNHHPYRVQVKQYLSILKQNTEYRLRFKSKGTIPWMVVSIGENEPDYSTAGLYKTIDLSRDWSEQVIDFKTNADIIANNKLYFQLGSQTGEAWVDDVHLLNTETSTIVAHLACENSGYCQLYQNHPNPANPMTTIRYTLLKSQKVELSVFNIEGKKVRTLVDAYQNPGEYAVIWTGQDSREQPLASGLYFYRLTSPDFISVKKIILAR